MSACADSPVSLTVTLEIGLVKVDFGVPLARLTTGPAEASGRAAGSCPARHRAEAAADGMLGLARCLRQEPQMRAVLATGGGWIKSDCFQRRRCWQPRFDCHAARQVRH